MREVEVGEVENRLGDVHHALRLWETISRVPCRPAVDVVNVDVLGVGRPDEVQVSAGHGAWAL